MVSRGRPVLGLRSTGNPHPRLPFRFPVFRTVAVRALIAGQSPIDLRSVGPLVEALAVALMVVQSVP